MKKYIPYIAIPLIIYLAIGFVKMQFNPAYWEAGERRGMLLVAFGAMVIYPLVKYIREDFER